MKLNLAPTKEIEIKQLEKEVKQAVGRKIDIEIEEFQRTETKTDKQGKETVEQYGYKLQIKEDLTAQEKQTVQSTVDAHTPKARLSLEERIDKLELAVKALSGG